VTRAWWLLIAGCGRIGFVPVTGDGIVGAGDGGTSDGVMGTAMLAPSSDTYIIQNSTVHNETDIQLFIGRSAGGNAAVTLLQFDVSTIPARATVTSASLQLYELTSMGQGTLDISVERVTSAWDATAVLYSTRPTWDAAPLSQQTVALQTPGFTQWDVTAAVQQWVSGAAPNFGFVVEAPAAPTGSMIQMASLDHGTAAERPQLVVVNVQ